jgi:hypothetical protein
VDVGVGVNEHAFGGKALGAVTGDGVVVVEMTMRAGLELNQAIVVDAGRQQTLGTDPIAANIRTCGELPSTRSGSTTLKRNCLSKLCPHKMRTSSTPKTGLSHAGAIRHWNKSRPSRWSAGCERQE